MATEKTVYEGKYTSIKVTYFLPKEKSKERSAGHKEGSSHIPNWANSFAEIQLLNATGDEITQRTVYWNGNSVSGEEYKEKLHEIHQRRDRVIKQQKEKEKFSQIIKTVTKRTEKYLDPNQKHQNQTLDFEDIQLSSLTSLNKKQVG